MSQEDWSSWPQWQVPQMTQVPQVPQSQPWPVPAVFPTLQVPVTSRITSSVRIARPAPVQPWPLEDPRFRRLLGALRPKECDLTALANTMWACAALKMQDFNVLNPIASAALSKFPKSIDPHRLSNISWACATLFFRHDPLVAAMADHARAKRGKIPASYLTSIVWSFAILVVHDAP